MKKKLLKFVLCAILIVNGMIHSDIEVEAAEVQYDKMVIADVIRSLNVREKPSTDSPIVGQMKRGSVGTIVEKGKQWTKITSGDVVGYVNNDYILTGSAMGLFVKKNIKTKEAIVAVDVLNIRSKKNTTSKILGKAKKGAVFEVKGASKDWVRIVYKKKDSFLARQYVELQYRFETATKVAKEELSVSGNNVTIVGNGNQNQETKPDTDSNQPVNGDANDIVNLPQSNVQLRKAISEYGLQFVGNPYVYGGTSLTNGADCSGFVQSVYSKFGIKLNRVSADQAFNGKERELSEIQIGDLVFYVNRGSSKIGHVSIYIGDGKVVHALNQDKGICISDMYYDTPYIVRNVIDEY